MPTATRVIHRRRVGTLVLFAVTLPGAATTAPGQDAVTKDRAAVAESGRSEAALIERWKKEAAEYRVETATQPATVLLLKNEPALHWTNPVRTTGDGLVFLWLDRGRPEAVACFYRTRWEGRMVEAHELLSLSTARLTATRGGRIVWSPNVAGITPRPIPGAPSPAATPAERLRQLRGLAREFHGFIDAEKSKTELRLLSQPVCRYEAGPARSADGALFAFVLTTDPEAFLLIDERPGTDGPAWHYAFARLTNHSVSARHRDRVVWQVAHDPDDGNPTKPFCSRWDVGPKP